MKRLTIIFTSLILMGALASCGEKPQSLEAKKTLLDSKKKALRALNEEINALESEIAELDPSIKAKARQASVSVEALASTEFKHFVEVQGKVEANNNVMVSPQTPGVVTAIYVREGQYVKKGQVLAQLDDAVMQSSLEEVRTALDLANVMFEKQEKLWNQKIGTEIQYLTAKNQKESLVRKLATLEKQTEMSKIKAPISGSVDEIHPKVGEAVSPGFPAFRVVNGRDLSLKAQLSENYIPYIRKGDLVNISFPALEKEIEARVTTVGQSINPVDRTFNVEVKLPSDPMLKANMFGELSINDRTIKDAITIPVSLLQQSEISKYVFITEEKEGKIFAKRTNIATGLSYDGKIVVEEGLAAGQNLIIAGYKGLSDGQEVVVQKDENLANNQ